MADEPTPDAGASTNAPTDAPKRTRRSPQADDVARFSVARLRSEPILGHSPPVLAAAFAGRDSADMLTREEAEQLVEKSQARRVPVNADQEA